MKMLLLASAGGAIGAGARYLVTLGLGRLLGTSFPWGTLTVNIVGSFLMGFIIEYIMLRAAGSAEMRTFLATGILGGFTTFSAFSLEVSAMLERGDYASAGGYILASLAISVAAVFAGLALVRAFL